LAQHIDRVWRAGDVRAAQCLAVDFCRFWSSGRRTQPLLLLAIGDSIQERHLGVRSLPGGQLWKVADEVAPEAFYRGH
jgi:hypothetical protein